MIMNWLVDLRKEVFFKGDQEQRQEILNGLTQFCPALLEEYNVSSRELGSLLYQQKRPEVEPNRTGLLKTRMIQKLQTQRPCLLLFCYKEHELERMKKESQEVRDIQKFKAVRALFVVQLHSEDGMMLTRESQEFEGWLKKSCEVESKYVLVYSEALNAKRLLKAMEDQTNYYYKDLIKRQKKKRANKQTIDTFDVEANVRALLQLLFYYDAQNKAKKQAKAKTELEQTLAHLSATYAKDLIQLNPMPPQQLQILLNLEEIREISDMLFFRTLIVKQREDKHSEELQRFVMHYYRKAQKTVPVQIEQLSFRETQWRARLFRTLSTVVALPSLADRYRHYAVYYQDVLSRELARVEHSHDYQHLLHNLPTHILSCTIKTTPKYYGRTEFTINYSHQNNILQNQDPTSAWQHKVVAMVKHSLTRLEQDKAELQDALRMHDQRTNCLMTNYNLFQRTVAQETTTLQEVDLLFWPLLHRLAQANQLNLITTVVALYTKYLKANQQNTQVIHSWFKLKVLNEVIKVEDKEGQEEQKREVKEWEGEEKEKGKEGEGQEKEGEGQEKEKQGEQKEKEGEQKEGEGEQKEEQKQEQEKDQKQEEGEVEPIKEEEVEGWKDEEGEVWELKVEQQNLVCDIDMMSHHQSLNSRAYLELRVNSQLFSHVRVVFNQGQSVVEVLRGGQAKVGVECSSPGQMHIKQVVLLKRHQGLTAQVVVGTQQLRYKDLSSWGVSCQGVNKVRLEYTTQVVQNEHSLVTMVLDQAEGGFSLVGSPHMKVLSSKQVQSGVEYICVFSQKGQFTLQVAHSQRVVLSQPIQVVSNFGVVTSKKQMHITSRRINVEVLSVTLGSTTLHDHPTRLALDETLSLYIGDTPMDRLTIAWKREGQSLEQECLILIEGQESRAQKPVQVEYHYQGTSALGVPLRLQVSVTNRAEVSQLLKVEVYDQSSFLMAGQLQFSGLFKPRQKNTYDYLLVPKLTGQCVLPLVKVSAFKDTENVFFKVTQPLNKYVLITPL